MKNIDRYDEEAKKLKTDDKTPKKKAKVEVSEYNPVPLYRSYGKTRREYKFIEELKLLLVRAAGAFVLGVPLMLLAVGFAALMIWGELLIKVIVTLALVLVVGVLATRMMRKRASFLRKLKRLCRERGYGLKIDRGAVKSLIVDDEKCDLTLETGDAVYYVNMIGAESGRQRLCLESDSEFKVMLPPLKNQFTTVFGFKTKVKKHRVDYSSVPSFEGKRSVKVLLMTPSFDHVEYRTSNVSTAPTGSGGEHFGITLYTAKGFLNMLKRGG